MIPMIDKTVGLDNKGVAFYHLGNYTEAIDYYDRVFAQYDKGNALEALENYSESITYFDRTLALDLKHVLALIDKSCEPDKLENHTRLREA